MHPHPETRQELAWRLRYQKCDHCGAARQQHIQAYTTAHRAEIVLLCPTSVFAHRAVSPRLTQLCLPFDDEQRDLPF